MASMSEDLPAPVGPQKANSSASPNDTSVRSRKALKPSTSKSSGRIARPRVARPRLALLGRRQFEQLAEQAGQAEVLDSPVGQVVVEQLAGRPPQPAVPLVVAPVGRGAVGGRQPNVDHLGEEPA